VAVMTAMVAVVMVSVAATNIEVHTRTLAVVAVPAVLATMAPLTPPLVAVAVPVGPIVDGLQIGALGRDGILHWSDRRRIGDAGKLKRGRSDHNREERSFRDHQDVSPHFLRDQADKLAR
jgi:hypothetical protein